MNGGVIAAALITVTVCRAAADWGPAERLPPPVNDGFTFAPCISPDGNTLYFCRYSAGNAHDIYYSERSGNNWTEPRKVPGGVNTTVSEHNPCLSWDGNRLYFDRAPSQGQEHQDIYVAEKVGASWGTAYPIPGRVNRPDKDEFSPSISADGRTLYFAAAFWPENEGQCNIWFSTWNGNEWGEPVLIREISTSGFGEIDPAVSYDGRYLYFFSARYEGAGIWRAEWLGNQWGKVVRLNDNINKVSYHPPNDPSVTGDGRTLFFEATDQYGLTYIYVSRWECEPAVAPTSLGKVKALFR